jgi:hypothetical protein
MEVEDMAVKVMKTNGETEIYSEQKIRASASRVGVPPALIDELLAEIRSKLYEGIPTSEIFEIIKSYLRHSTQPHLAAKYNLKSALAELGPSGYPFEQYVAALLSATGYTTITNQILMGKCVSHEVDVVAEKGGIKYFIEVKFHSSPAQRTDVRVPLYIHSRYEDLSSRIEGHTEPWIVTNTRFSSDAIAYANCVNIRLTSWGYPNGEGIMDLIEKTKLHPVTMLDNLTPEDKRLLLSQKVVLCKQLVGNSKNLALIPPVRRAIVAEQAERICAT